MMRAPPPPPVRALGYASAAWCLGFAGVSVWLVAGMVGQPGGSGLVIVSVLALALKLAGAPLLLGLLLGVAPAILTRWGLLST